MLLPLQSQHSKDFSLIATLGQDREPQDVCEISLSGRKSTDSIYTWFTYAENIGRASMKRWLLQFAIPKYLFAL